MRKKVAVLIRLSLLVMAPALACADTISLGLTGDYTSTDIWGAGSLAGGANPGYGGFPGTAAWPGPIQSPVGGDAYLYKISNQNNAALGAGSGGPFPSGAGIYYGGAGSTPNTNGGTLSVKDEMPVLELSTVTFQIQIGQAFGYDLLNNDLSLVKLHYTTETGSGELSANYSSLLNRFYNGAVDMPTGEGGSMQPEDIYVNLWGLQWDLSGISGITSFEIQFIGVEHASLTQLQLDQSSSVYDYNVLDQTEVWTSAGANANWSTAANWEAGVVPASGKIAQFEAGSEVILDADQSVATLDLRAADGFEVKSVDGNKLSISSGINAASESPAAYTISASIDMLDYSLIDLNAGNTLTISGSITGSGFFKKGAGTLFLTGYNLYDGGNSDLVANGLMIRGGVNYISGSNSLTGSNTIEFKVRDDTTVILHGGDNVLDSKFALSLLSPSSKLVLGDAEGRSDLTASGVSGAVGTSVVRGSRIVGGSSDISTLTLDIASGSREFGGSLGGSGTNENNLGLVKRGAGVQILSGTNSYSGATRVEQGMLQLGSSTALSANSNVQLNGGVLGLGTSGITLNLGTNSGEIQFTGDGGFAASLADREVTLNGGANLSWGQTVGFVADGHKLMLAHASADRMVDLTNAIDLGSQIRSVQVANGSASVDARLSGVLSGSGGLEKSDVGTLELTAANTYTGGTSVKEGILSLSGVNGSIKGDVTVAAGATLLLNNSAAANNANRLDNLARVTLGGAIVNFSHSGGSASYAESIGELALAKGGNVITTSQAASGQTSALTFASLSRAAGATLNFSAATLGTRNNVYFTAAPTLDDGIIGAWATVGTTYEFATYGANGVVAYSGYNTNLAEAGWASSNNVKLNTAAGMTTTLTGGRTINSLVMNGATSGSTGNKLNLGGNELRIGSGGFIATGGASTRTNEISNGTITAGNAVDTDAELIATIAGTQTYISARIVDNGAGKVSLVKAGSGSLILGGNNSYGGDTIVNQGTLIINGTNSGGGAVAVRKNATLNVNGALALGGLIEVDGTLGGSGSLYFSSGSELKGSGTVNHALTVGSAAGQLNTLSPGNSPGTMSFGASQTWANGGAYVWELSDVDAGAGVGWDVINITGGLDIVASNFMLEVVSLNNLFANGLVADFDALQDYSWTILTASGGITGFDADKFSLDLGNFANAHDGFWSLSQSGNSLNLNYAAVPEPSTWALLAGGLTVVICLRKRRRA